MIAETKAYINSIDPKAKSLLITTCQSPGQKSYQALRISADILHLIEIENTKPTHEWHIHLPSNTAQHNNKPASQGEVASLVKKISGLLHAVSAHRGSLFVEKESTL
jgi:hypothetical protein